MDLWVEVAKQVPALGVLVFVVITFLNHMAKEAERKAEESEKSEKRLADLTNQYHQSNEAHAEILAANNEALGSIQTLLTLAVDKDLRDAASTKRRAQT